MNNKESLAVMDQMNDILCSLQQELVPRSVNAFILYPLFEVKPCALAGYPQIKVKLSIEVRPSLEIFEHFDKDTKYGVNYSEVMYSEDFDTGRRMYFESSFREVIKNMVMELVKWTNKEIEVFRKEEK